MMRVKSTPVMLLKVLAKKSFIYKRDVSKKVYILYNKVKSHINLIFFVSFLALVPQNAHMSDRNVTTKKTLSIY